MLVQTIVQGTPITVDTLGTHAQAINEISRQINTQKGITVTQQNVASIETGPLNLQIYAEQKPCPFNGSTKQTVTFTFGSVFYSIPIVTANLVVTGNATDTIKLGTVTITSISSSQVTVDVCYKEAISYQNIAVAIMAIGQKGS